MPLPDTLKQPISFERKFCQEDCSLVVSTQDICSGIVVNPTFLGNPSVAWTLAGGTQTGTQPATFSVITPFQMFTNQPIDILAGDYVAYYSMETDSAAWQTTLRITPGGVGEVLFNSATQLQVGSVAFNIASDLTATDLELEFNPVLNSNITINYFYICPVSDLVPETDFCFQLPLFETGSELLGILDNKLSYGTTFTYAVPTNDAYSPPAGPACPAPFNNTSQVIDALAQGLQLAKGGKYFIEAKMGDVLIDYSLNYSDDTPSEVVISLRDVTLAREDEIAITNADSGNENVFFLGTTDWVALDNPSFWIKSRSECNGSTLEQIKYDLDVDQYSFTSNYTEDTFTALDDTFYNLKFRLTKTSSVVVTITDSAGTDLVITSSDGILFDKIFNTGTLPVDKTITIKWEITELTSYPQVDFNVDVLTQVELYRMCQWVTWIEDSDVPNIAVLTATTVHDTTTEATGVTYHPNIEYCFDLTSLTPDEYLFRAVNSCDTSENYTSNTILVCDSSKGLNLISWDHGGVKCIGDETLDNDTYTSAYFFWVKANLQDLTIDEEREVYRRSDGFMNVPYVKTQGLRTLQVWPLQEFMRDALAIAMQDTFMIDGVEYQKISDDAFEPQFTANYNQPMRIVVHKVGDFSISRNS